MQSKIRLLRRAGAAVLLAVLVPIPCGAQPKGAAKPAAASPRLGFEAFGAATFGWPAANDSFDAAGLDPVAMEFGGGGRVTSIWRDLFVQGAFSRWSDTGERALVDSEGNRHSLGIPLSVKAKYFDATVGWKSEARRQNGTLAAWSYVGAGAGVANYSEESPFAEADDDLDTTEVTYHLLAGAEIPIGRWLAVGFEARYRFVPGVLGDAGASAALDEDDLGGFQTAVSLRVGFGQSERRRLPPRSSPPGRTAQPERSPEPAPPAAAALTGVILSPAPVYLFPDPARTPLRTLSPGTVVRILEENPDWYRVEFPDPQFGPRVGYVLRKFVQLGKSR